MESLFGYSNFSLFLPLESLLKLIKLIHAMKTFLSVIFFELLSILSLSQCFGQQTEDSLTIKEMAPSLKTLGIATGIHINRYPMIELGYFQHTTFEFPMTFGGSYTLESYFLNDVIVAPKVNYWMNFLFLNTGLSIPWYFDFNGQNSLKIRPEIGFGFKNFKINYSTNISITNKNMKNIGNHFLSINYYIKVKEE